MSQQHAQFEGEFRDGPQPHEAYQEHYVEMPVSSPTPMVTPPQGSYLQPLHIYVNVPGQVPQQAPVQQTRPAPQARPVLVQQPRQEGMGIAGRVVLGIFSLFFVMLMFLISLSMVDNSWYNPGSGIMTVMTVFLSLLFAVLALVINLAVNRKR